MLRHHLSLALRRIKGQRFYSAVSVAVLALGLLCFIATYLFVSYLRGYDRTFASSERTYLVAQRVESQRLRLSLPFVPRSSLLLAEQLRLEARELEAVARYLPGQVNVTVDAEPVLRNVAYAERQFLDVFDFTAVAGDLSGALSEPRTAVITQSAAESMFGAQDAVGKTVAVTMAREPVDVVIRAVIADPPKASHLNASGLFSLGFDLLVSWDLFEGVKQPFFDSWGNTIAMTYARLPADGSLPAAEFEQRLASIVERHAAPALALRGDIEIGFEMQPLAAIAMNNLQNAFQSLYGTSRRVHVFAAVLTFAFVILAIACLNFVNLATAQASGRGLDVGTRRTLGATSAQLIAQDLLQTCLLVGFALALALVAVAPVNRLLSGPWQLAFAVPWQEPRFWLFLVALLAGVTLAAGLYPAVVLARIGPMAALRLGAVRAGPKWLRTLLAGAQFAAASFLVVAVIVLLSQGQALRETLLGRFEDPYVGFFLGNPTASIDRNALAAELEPGAGILGTATVNQPPWEGLIARRQLSRGAAEQAPAVIVEDYFVGHDYFALMGLPTLAGRVFARDRADDLAPRTDAELATRQGRPIPMVLDRAAARALGWSNPGDAVGEFVQESVVAGTSTPGQYEVIGVVETVPMAIRARESEGIAYTLRPNLANYWLVRLRNDGIAASLAHIDGVMKSFAPDAVPLRRTFLDESFESAYWTFALISRVCSGLALFAIVISGIGLFGMASYLTVRRTREIGIRKVQGAAPQQILRLLFWDFSKPAVIANLIAWPVAFVAAERYLDVFAQRIALTPAPFVLSLVATMVLAWVAVATRVLPAARVRPSEALRHG